MCLPTTRAASRENDAKHSKQEVPLSDHSKQYIYVQLVMQGSFNPTHDRSLEFKATLMFYLWQVTSSSCHLVPQLLLSAAGIAAAAPPPLLLLGVPPC
jgi:hypothetical protein